MQWPLAWNARLTHGLLYGWLDTCHSVDALPAAAAASILCRLHPTGTISKGHLTFTNLYNTIWLRTARNCTRKLDYCNSLDYVYGLWGLLLDFLRYSFLLFLVPLVTFLFWLRFLYVNSTHYLIVCSSLNLYYVCTVFYLYNNSRLLYALGFL